VPRLACVDVPGFAIQLLVRAHPDWRRRPVALVEEDRPNAAILAVNERARRAAVLPGQRYATALALCRDLRAGILPPAAIQRHVGALTTRLRRFSPDIEPAADLAGVFWLNAEGLLRVFASLDSWAESIHEDLAREGLSSTVVVGFTRFGTYATARISRGVRVFASEDAERAAARRVPLASLDIDPAVRDFLCTLGITTVDGFLDLPRAATRARLGDAAWRLHRLASGDLWSPLVPAPLDPVFERRLDFDTGEGDAERLIFLIKPLVDALVADLAAAASAAARLACRLSLDDRSARDIAVTPAEPTLDAVQLITLLRLKLAATALSARVTGLTVHAVPTPAAPATLRLFETRARRNLDAARRAIARLRAMFGDTAVVRARLADAHLPRARVVWEPVATLGDRAPAPRAEPARVLVRRLFDAPLRISAAHDDRSREWLRAQLEDGRIDQIAGPYLISGAWWRAGGVARDYYFLHSPAGDVRWMYYDRKSRAWFMEGRIE